MLSVASELGVGTTFSIFLPKTEASRLGTVRSINEDESPRGTETVLVVEDEDILRELAVQVLESLGYHVLAAEDGAEAIRTLRSDEAHRIDLVVTDLMMPRMSGRELVAWISHHFAEMRVLFMSGYTDDEIIRGAIEGAEAEYLQKPFTPKALAHKIRKVLDRPNLAHLAAA